MRFFILCLFISVSAFGQNKKVPADDDDLYLQTRLPYQPPAITQKVSYTEVTLFGSYSDELDTQKMHIVKCDADGQIINETDYTYSNDHIFDYDPRLIVTKIQSCTKTDYFYDKLKHSFYTIQYRQLPANSIGGIREAALHFKPKHIAPLRLKYSSQENSLIEKDFKYFIDSFLRINPPDIYKILGNWQIVYDQNDNCAYQQDSLKHTKIIYTYNYTGNGQPATQHILLKHFNKDGSLYAFVTKEHLFIYDSSGKVLTIRTYVAPGDSSAGIAVDKYKTLENVFHYNTQGLPDTLLFKETGVTRRHVITYANAHRSSYTITNVANGKTDTIVRYKYKYAGNELAEMEQENMIPAGNYIRDVYTYNNVNLPTEIRRYVSSYDQFDKVIQQRLFFYGNKNADAITASRSLYVIPEKRKRNIQARQGSK